MEISFKGKRALVTGAGKGIGRDIAKALVRCGAETVAVSRTQEDLDSLKKEVPSIQTVQADLRDWDGSRKILEAVGCVDLLVNNAGVSRTAPFFEVTKDDCDFVYDVNIKSVINVSQVFAKGMVDSGHGGAIVNVSSVASQVALNEHTVYCSSKGAVDMLTKVMAMELGPKKIRVNSVNPTVVMTDMGRYAWSDPKKADPMLARIPLGKFVEIEDVVNAVLFLLSDKAAMINGTLLPIDGGILAN
ncbi:L-xylulose reductase-like isoform X1 [Haliotis rubra]|uniref:L-xylulose reductase-like isoform X1 n=1 Tax=Haliotis rubra TaxID=36100 RepID=UPI001EE514E0|nr:L-xylulose reductase-like isoform X1 [Haliotis rubra]